MGATCCAASALPALSSRVPPGPAAELTARFVRGTEMGPSCCRSLRAPSFPVVHTGLSRSRCGPIRVRRLHRETAGGSGARVGSVRAAADEQPPSPHPNPTCRLPEVVGSAVVCVFGVSFTMGRSPFASVFHGEQHPDTTGVPPTVGPWVSNTDARRVVDSTLPCPDPIDAVGSVFRVRQADRRESSPPASRPRSRSVTGTARGTPTDFSRSDHGYFYSSLLTVERHEVANLQQYRT